MKNVTIVISLIVLMVGVLVGASSSGYVSASKCNEQLDNNIYNLVDNNGACEKQGNKYYINF